MKERRKKGKEEKPLCNKLLKVLRISERYSKNIQKKQMNSLAT